mgnify:CR=1 FL=1
MSSLSTSPRSLDPYVPGVSVIHSLDPRVKAVLALGLILSAALAPVKAWPIYLLLASLSLSAAILSELGVARVLRRSALALPFMFAALPLVATTPGLPVVQSALGPWEVCITSEGLEYFLSIVVKSWISVQTAVVLVGSTPFPALMAALRALRIPRLLVAVSGLMWRYLFVFSDEALRLMRAREARSSVPLRGQAGAHAALRSGRGGRSMLWRARVTGGMVGNLFLRAFERAGRIHAAMLARGYDGEVRLGALSPVTFQDWAVLGCGLGLLSLLTFVGILFWG